MITSLSVPGKFTVNMLTSQDILDFKSWQPKHYKNTCLSLKSQSKTVPQSRNQDFTVPSFMEFQYDSAKKGTVVASQYIGGIAKHTFVLRHTSQNLLNPTIPMENAYPT
ncbi:hypothetical protein ANN_26410 [Periplaneta americana]|uniref:Uncharacterized protein n=1 Tax=Periplaneta americana TaxID=6978 RepID=A0ABQ8RXZ8_PERAM|nr:hypothetical protein ANN_26410 [Periplaneta americana]